MPSKSAKMKLPGLTAHHAADGHIIGHDHPATHRIERSDSGVVDRESHLDDLVAVANLAIAHTSDRAVSLSHGAHQSSQGAFVPAESVECTTTSPGLRESMASISSHKGHLPNVIGFHPRIVRARPQAAFLRSATRAQAMVHGLVAIAQAVQDVAHRRDVKVGVNELRNSAVLEA